LHGEERDNFMTCCLSMATVNPTPGACQNVCCCTGDGGASNTQSILNTVGKFGLSLAGVVSGRPVQTTGQGVKVGASAAYNQAVAGAPNMTVIIVVLAIAAVIIFMMMRK
jgi:hypothetical protein